MIRIAMISLFLFVTMPAIAEGCPPTEPGEASTLALVERIGRKEFAGQLGVGDVMAIVWIESKFVTSVVSNGNWGLMQVRPATAREMGMTGSPRQLLDPETGLRFGMRYLWNVWYLLTDRFGRVPTVTEWVAGYHKGPNAVVGQSEISSANYLDITGGAENHILGADTDHVKSTRPYRCFQSSA